MHSFKPAASRADSPDAATLLTLGREDVAALLDHDETIEQVRRAFVAHSGGAGRIFPLVREAVGDQSVFGIKSGDIAGDGVLGLKAAGFWPGNAKLRKDAHQATILIVDPATGRPTALLDGNQVTTMRTGAAGAIGIGLLARPESARLCLFGTGVQAGIQLDYALRVRPTIRHVSYVTASGAPDERFEQRFRPRCTIEHAPDAARAVTNADIVITATPGGAALFPRGAIKPGTHINAVGADTRGKRELPPLLLEDSRVVVDDAMQARAVGECQWAPDLQVTEIGELLMKTAAFERQPDDITVFDMTGLALQDLTVAQLLVDKAARQGCGRRLPWPW